MRRNLPSTGQRRAAARVRQRKKKEERFNVATTKTFVHAKPWNERFVVALDNNNGSTELSARRGERVKSQSTMHSFTKSNGSTTDRADGVPIITKHSTERYDRKTVQVTRGTSPFDEKKVQEILHKMTAARVPSVENKKKSRPDSLTPTADGFQSRYLLHPQSLIISVEQ